MMPNLFLGSFQKSIIYVKMSFCAKFYTSIPICRFWAIFVRNWPDYNAKTELKIIWFSSFCKIVDYDKPAWVTEWYDKPVQNIAPGMFELNTL